jgi:hypothetical protein
VFTLVFYTMCVPLSPSSFCRPVLPPDSAVWTYVCPPGCADEYRSGVAVNVYGCSVQNVYDIITPVCMAAMHQVQRTCTYRFIAFYLAQPD